MTKLEFKFDTEPDNKLIKFFEEDTVDFDFWCSLDLFIDGKSFFKNFQPDYYSGDDHRGFNEYSTDQRGFSAPVFPFIHSILEAPEKLINQKQVIIEDEMGQSSIEIFATLEDSGTVILAVRIWDTGNVYYWYDGQKVFLQNEIPNSKINVMKYEEFKDGCQKSVKEYLESLLLKYPIINQNPYFNYLITEASK